MTVSVQRCVDLHEAPDAPARARRVATGFLTEAERVYGGPASPAVTDAVLLVTSELVTNAVRHAPGPCTLRLTLHDESVLVEVSDTSASPPRPRAPDITGARGGWGWTLIARVANEVRVIPGPGGGKTVLARLPW
ncbi:ATP-binding protein [Streptomyces sp. NPDC051310]|uniref:ATP-binding protein n=1 Tax=Streptomyces sp. NPDC051310 TaxID=3365649 RepID=UPI0037931A7D